MKVEDGGIESGCVSEITLDLGASSPSGAPFPYSTGQPQSRDSLTCGGLSPPACQSECSWFSLPLWSNPGGEWSERDRA